MEKTLELTASEIVPFEEDGGQLPSVFNPAKVFDNQAKADAVIAFAKRMKDWPTLEVAADTKIEELRELVAWWNANVSGGHGAGRGNKKVGDRGPFLSVPDAEHLTRFRKQQISKIRYRLKDPFKFRGDILGAAYKKAMEEAVNERIAQNTGDDEWYTPTEYVEAARDVLGQIELDAATSETAQETVKADNYFTIKDNALTQEWHGRVWLNPPYSRELILKFVEKLVAEYRAGNTTEAVLLTHNYTDTKWFHVAASAASAICFTRGRIHFYQVDGEKNAPTNGQAFCYFGPNPERFAEVFAAFGFVVTPVI